MELLIDTTTNITSLGISDNGIMKSEKIWVSERNQSVELMPNIIDLIKSVNLTLDDLNGIFVLKGPGGFTSVRIGISVAKSLSFASEIPLVAIPSTLVEAYPYIDLESDNKILALIPVGRTRVYAAEYSSLSGFDDVSYKVFDFPSSLLDTDSKVIYCGEAVKLLMDQGILTSEHNVIISESPTRKLSVMAQLGYTRLIEGLTVDPISLEPIYLSSAQIESAEKNLIKNNNEGDS
tara:strand:- start:2012 stop:2716 length:705 start_codon:yes stop_codon:yes gene_type:complete